MEGANPVKFMSEFLVEVFGKYFFPTPPLLDRAHRLGLPQTSENGRAKPFIMLFHHFSDKERIIWRKREQLLYRGHKIYIYSDISATLAKKRAAFNKYRRNVHFSLLYPARLRISFQGQTNFFDSPTDAQAFCDQQWED